MKGYFKLLSALADHPGIALGGAAEAPVVVVVVALLFNVHGKHLRSSRDGQLT